MFIHIFGVPHFSNGIEVSSYDQIPRRFSLSDLLYRLNHIVQQIDTRTWLNVLRYDY